MDKGKLSQLNSYETDFVFHEIFEKNVYLRNGIRLKRNAVVVDIGANIGIFSLFVKEKCPTARIYAFEPIPEAYRCLVENCARYADSIHAENLAISSKQGTAGFRYYPGYSVISGLYADRTVDSKVIETGMRGFGKGENTVADYQRIHQIVSKRFEKSKLLDVRTQTVKGIMQEFNLARIHLLKIDAERSEESILDGIDPENWPYIDQIVLEVHSEKGRRSITRLLKSSGYQVTAEDDLLTNCEIGMVYAVRSPK